MSKPTQLPDALKRREILYGPDPDPAQLSGYGDLYLESGRLLDALEFYAVAQSGQGIEAIKRQAIEQGNTFLGQRLAQLGVAELSEAEWATLGEVAESRGLTLFAITAFRAAGQVERADALAGPAPPSAD